METVKMYVMRDIEEYRKQLKISYSQLADMLMKDATVVKRQLTEVRGGVQLYTAYEIAAALGGKVVFVPPEQLSDVTSTEREELNRQITALTEANLAQEARLTKQAEIIERLQNRIIEKDERLERKDDLIRQLLIEKNVIKE